MGFRGRRHSIDRLHRRLPPLLFERLSYSGTRLTAALTVAFAAAILESVALLATPLTRKQIRELIARKRDVSPVSA